MSGAVGGVTQGGMRTVDPVVANEALELYLGATGGFLELDAEFPGGERGGAWLDVAAGDLPRYVALHEELGCTQTLSLARPRRRWGSCLHFPVLWVRVEQKPAAEALRACARRTSQIPMPTVVLREGSSSRYTAFWALRQPVRSYEEVTRWNERLSFALGGRRGAAHPDRFSFAPPGSVIRREGKRPCVVTAAHVGMATYSVADVVDRLRDAPDLDALRERGYAPAP